MDKNKFKKKKENFFSKEDSEDESKDAEILFMGIDAQTKNGESYEESEVEVEAQYIDVVDEIEKCRRRNKVLKEKHNFQTSMRSPKMIISITMP